MTITRLGQVTAETGSPGEYAKITGGAVTLSSDIKRSGYYSWNVGNGAGIGLTFPIQTGIRSNFAGYMVNELLGGTVAYLHGNGAHTQALVVRLDSGNLSVYTSGVLRYSQSWVSAGWVMGAWNDIGIHYIAGAEGFATVYLNGVEFYTYIGNLVGNLDYYVSFYKQGITDGFGTCYVDDMYIDAVTADEENVAPSKKVFLSSIVSNQSVVQWTPIGDTPNYRCIDDEGVPDNDTTYVKALNSGLQDLYAVTPISVPADYKIRAVIPTAIAKKGDAGLPATLTPVISDGSDILEGDPQNLRLSYAPAWYRFTEQPNGEAWEESEYEAMQYGFKTSGVF